MPNLADNWVAGFCQFLCQDSTPVYLNIEPGPDDQPLDCFSNVRRRVEQTGGRMQLGWVIWEWPRVLIQAELHAVYDLGDGQPWVDLTPSADPAITRRLFLPDDSATYDFDNEEVRRDNIRRPLSDDLVIDSYIEANERFTRITNALPGVGEIQLTPEQATEIDTAQAELQHLHQKLLAKYP